MYTLNVRGGMILAHDFISGDFSFIEDSITNRYAMSKDLFYVDNLKVAKTFDGVFKTMRIADKGIYADLMKMSKKNLLLQLDKELLEYSKQNQIQNFFNKVLGIEHFKNIFMLDISHLGGDNNVGGLVCFSNNVKNKKLYRHYKVSFQNNNDAGSIKEICERICGNLAIVENIDVFIIDGGIVQKNVVERVFSTFGLNIPVLALEKNSKHTTHEILCGDDVIELTNPTILRYFARIQDEVHRFANTFMHAQSFKKTTNSIFSSINGVGPKRQAILEENFNSLEDLLSASVDDLEKIGFPNKLAQSILKSVAELL